MSWNNSVAAAAYESARQVHELTGAALADPWGKLTAEQKRWYERQVEVLEKFPDTKYLSVMEKSFAIVCVQIIERIEE